MFHGVKKRVTVAFLSTESFPRGQSQHGWGRCRGTGILKDQTSFPWWQPRGLHPGGTCNAWPEKGKGVGNLDGQYGHVDATLETCSTPQLQR